MVRFVIYVHCTTTSCYNTSGVWEKKTILLSDEECSLKMTHVNVIVSKIALH